MTDRAVCVGINDYPGRGMKLRGCRNDARAWARTLVKHYDVARDDVTMLLDDEATAAHITGAMKDLIVGATRGDRLVFTFSGHGTYVPDENDDEIRYDEALCPYDCDERLVVDDEIREILAGIPRGVRCTFVSDSCHSGSVTRLAPGDRPPPPTRRARFIPPTRLGITVSRRAQIAMATERAVRANRRSESSMIEVLLSGCRDDEYSYDDKFGHRYHGAMTFHALASLAAADWRIRYEDWVVDVNARLRADMYEQHPQLEGTASSKRRWAFG